MQNAECRIAGGATIVQYYITVGVGASTTRKTSKQLRADILHSAFCVIDLLIHRFRFAPRTARSPELGVANAVTHGEGFKGSPFGRAVAKRRHEKKRANGLSWAPAPTIVQYYITVGVGASTTRKQTV